MNETQKVQKIQKGTGFGQSLGQAWNGIVYAWKTQAHMRFHGFAAVIVLLTAWWLDAAVQEWLLLIYAIGSVITAETLNTALEAAVDVAHPDFHPLAGIAKDVAAGAVLITAIQSVIIGLLILGPKLWDKIF